MCELVVSKCFSCSSLHLLIGMQNIFLGVSFYMVLTKLKWGGEYWEEYRIYYQRWVWWVALSPVGYNLVGGNFVDLFKFQFSYLYIMEIVLHGVILRIKWKSMFWTLVRCLMCAKYKCEFPIPSPVAPHKHHKDYSDVPNVSDGKFRKTPPLRLLL